MSYGTGRSGFNKALDKGTAPTSTEPDWDAIVAICDFLRRGEVKPKYAIDSLMKKISGSGDNMIVALKSLQVLESVVKNCGPKLHDEVANPAFMDFMKTQVKTITNSDCKSKLLELIQCWAHAFRENSDYKVVNDVFNELKNEGFQFPRLHEADAMFTSEVLPDWKETDSCFYCRTEFTTFTRRHHCRACGHSCCGRCSSKKSAIPKFGIEQEVRVCDGCYTKLNPTSSSSGSKSSATPGESDSDLPAEYLNSALYKQSLEEQKAKPASSGKSEAELEEEEQLQLALAISQSEAEAKQQEKKKRQTYMSLDAKPPADSGVTHTSAPPVSAAPVVELEEQVMSPELQKYLNRDYWEKKEKDNKSTPPSSGNINKGKSKATDSYYATVTTTPSAPPPTQTEPQYTNMQYTTNNDQNEADYTKESADPLLEEDEMEREEFMRNISSSIDVFVNRMKSNSMRGRSIINDSAVQTLFSTLQNMHPHLLQYTQKLEEKRSHFEGLQDKLAQLRDAREALNSLRQEHEEKRRIEAEEKAKRKQIQMMQKLDILRKQKQQVLERQRMMAMQQLQQHEAEMKARIEQQKRDAQMRQMQLHGFPQELQVSYAGYPQSQVGYGGYQQYSVPAAHPGIPNYTQQQPDYEAYNNPALHSGMATAPQGFSNYNQLPNTVSGGGYQHPNAYNMQGMGEALPSVPDPSAYQAPVSHYSMAGQPVPPGQDTMSHQHMQHQPAMDPNQQNYMMPPQLQQPQMYQGQPQQNQLYQQQYQPNLQQQQQQGPAAGQPNQQTAYAELISFD